jgi:transcriptional regulator with XRE-family HTH domain/DNA-binding CsgD family transcriptional regulator
MHTAQKVATAIRALREALGISQAGLAERLEVSRSTVIRWEKGDSLPQGRHFAVLEKLAENQEGESAWLFSGETFLTQEVKEWGGQGAHGQQKVPGREGEPLDAVDYRDLVYRATLLLGEFQAQLDAARQVQTVKKAIQSFLGLLGIDCFLYFQVFRGEIRKEPRGFFMTDVDVEWLKHYDAQHYKLHDPTWKFSWSSVLPVSTDQIYSEAVAKKQIRARMIIDDLRTHQHGYAYCLAIPLFGPCCKAALSLAVRDRNKVPMMELLRPQLQYFGNLIYDKMHKLIDHYHGETTSFRVRKSDRDLLVHLLQGSLVKVIAKDFGISESAVRQRIERLQERFGVQNRQELCLLAIARGLILHDLQHIKVLTSIFDIHSLKEFNG